MCFFCKTNHIPTHSKTFCTCDAQQKPQVAESKYFYSTDVFFFLSHESRLLTLVAHGVMVLYELDQNAQTERRIEDQHQELKRRDDDNRRFYKMLTEI